MGLFDTYIPDPPFVCRRCGRVLNGWQGKDGPSGLLTWRQGVATPSHEGVDADVALAGRQLSELRLPSSFVVDARCPCRLDFMVSAICTCTGGVWTASRLLTPEDVDVIYYGLSNERRSALKKQIGDYVAHNPPPLSAGDE
jgi:hypothetical protein